jgi:hypothetical protein
MNSRISFSIVNPKCPAMMPVKSTQAIPKLTPLKASLPRATPDAMTMA